MIAYLRVRGQKNIHRNAQQDLDTSTMLYNLSCMSIQIFRAGSQFILCSGTLIFLKWRSLNVAIFKSFSKAAAAKYESAKPQLFISGAKSAFLFAHGQNSTAKHSVVTQFI